MRGSEEVWFLVSNIKACLLWTYCCAELHIRREWTIRSAIKVWFALKMFFFTTSANSFIAKSSFWQVFTQKYIFGLQYEEFYSFLRNHCHDNSCGLLSRCTAMQNFIFSVLVEYRTWSIFQLQKIASISLHASSRFWWRSLFRKESVIEFYFFSYLQFIPLFMLWRNFDFDKSDKTRKWQTLLSVHKYIWIKYTQIRWDMTLVWMIM